MTEDQKDNRDTASAITEAIRTKRGDRKASTEAELAALEASLIADLDAFDQHALSSAIEAETKAAAAAPKGNYGNQFPEISENAGPALKVAPRAVDSANTPVQQAPAAPSSSLLSQLKQQAELRARETDVQTKRREKTSVMLDLGLRRVFEYVHELVEQLNVLQPTVTRSYTLFGVVEYKDLVWQRGFADYRTDQKSATTTFESVLMSFNLKATREVRLERDASGIDSLQKMLIDSGVVFRCEEKRNARHMVEKATFFISPEIKASLRWLAYPDRDGVILETRNFERFGDLRYFVPVEYLDQPMLEEFGRLLLGQPSRFRDFIRR